MAEVQRYKEGTEDRHKDQEYFSDFQGGENQGAYVYMLLW